MSNRCKNGRISLIFFVFILSSLRFAEVAAQTFIHSVQANAIKRIQYLHWLLKRIDFSIFEGGLNNLKKISSILLLALYGLVMLHNVVPHEHTVSFGHGITENHHHHEEHSRSHDHHHDQHDDDEGNSVFDLLVALFNIHSQQFDSNETHFQELRASDAKAFSAVDIQLHLFTPFQDYHGPPIDISETIEFQEVVFVIDYYSTFHSLRAPPSLALLIIEA